MAGAAGLTRIDHTAFFESAGGQQNQDIGLMELATGENSWYAAVFEVVGMEAQHLDVLPESDTL